MKRTQKETVTLLLRRTAQLPQLEKKPKRRISSLQHTLETQSQLYTWKEREKADKTENLTLHETELENKETRDLYEKYREKRKVLEETLNLKEHYEAWEALTWENFGIQKQGTVLLVGKIARHHRSLILSGENLCMHSVLKKDIGYRHYAVLSLIPYNVYVHAQMNGEKLLNSLKKTPLKMLENPEQTETGFQLYAESEKTDFKTCMKLAEKLL